MSNSTTDYRAWLESMGAKKNTVMPQSIWEYIFQRENQDGNHDELEVAVCLEDETSGTGDELFSLNVAKHLHEQPEGKDIFDVELQFLNRSQVASLLLILGIILPSTYFDATQ